METFEQIVFDGLTTGKIKQGKINKIQVKNCEQTGMYNECHKLLNFYFFI